MGVVVFLTAMLLHKGSNMARITFAVLASALVLATPVLANQPVRPATVALKGIQPVGLQAGARVGAFTSKKQSSLAPAAAGAILAGLVAVGAGVGIATSSGGHSTSP